MSQLLKDQPRIANVGLDGFVGPIRAAGGTVDHVAWAPPGNSPAVASAVATLTGNERVRHANEVAFGRFLAAQPQLVGVAPAREVIAGLGEREILHAGPPIAWEQMAGPMRGGILGAIVFEGWADGTVAAEGLAGSGEIIFRPCHDVGAVAPMAGIVSPSMPVWVIENAGDGRRAYSNMNEGLGRVLRFGANDAEVLARLAWMRDRLGPILQQVLEVLAPLDLKPLVARALHMGDEAHNRNVAATSLLYRHVSRAALRACSVDDVTEVLSFIDDNDHFFLNLSMAMCKAMLDAAHGVSDSSMVTAMARNGVRFGIRLSGAGDRWFEADAPRVDGLFFAGYAADDAAPDLGDSSITETAGLGGFAMAASPAVVRFVGGTPDDAVAHSRRMRHITLGPNPAFTLPQLGFRGTPSGIDARQVVDTSILPIINTGIAHRDAGVGQIGAGITEGPAAAFAGAVVHLANAIEGSQP